MKLSFFGHGGPTRSTGFLVAILSLLGCEDTVCPPGSAEKNGKCQQVDTDDVTETDGSTADSEQTDAGIDCERMSADGACDPCAEDENGRTACDANASCTAKNGPALCECNKGYEGDGKTCTRNPCIALEGERESCGANTQCTAKDDTTAECTCNEGFADCDDLGIQTGCETSLADDALNCGACGFACASGITCVEGVCEPQASSMALSFGGNACALTPKGQVLCWDWSSAGVIDKTPVRVALNGQASQVSLGGAGGSNGFGCARLANTDTLACWGNNLNGQLGTTNTTATSSHALNVLGLDSFAAGYTHTCATAGGQVHCWGLGSSGVLADGHDYSNPAYRGYDASRPVLTPASRPVAGAVQVSSGLSQSCARLQTGAVQCWGYHGSPYRAEGVIGDTGPENSHPLSDATSICGGLLYGCALRASGTVACWGVEPAWIALHGVFPSNAPPRNRFRPVDLHDITEIACGSGHACALTQAGEVYCWGSNLNGQLGLGTSETAREKPVRVPGLSDVAHVYAGAFSCATLRNGSLYCWGDGKHLSPKEVTTLP